MTCWWMAAPIAERDPGDPGAPALDRARLGRSRRGRARAGAARWRANSACAMRWRPLPASYDYILIDCPPSLNLLTVNALTAATGVLVPLQCEYYALEGLSQLMKTVDLVKQNLNPNLEIQGVVLTMYDRRNNLCDMVAADVRRHFGDKVYRDGDPAQCPPVRGALPRQAGAALRSALRRARRPISSSPASCCAAHQARRSPGRRSWPAEGKRMSADSKRGLGRGLSALLGERPCQARRGGEPRPAPSADRPARAQPAAAAPAFRSRRAGSAGGIDPQQRHPAADPGAAGIPTKPGMHEIVAGERRWRAAQIAKLHEVPVLVRELSDREVLELALVENVQRHDLSALEEARRLSPADRRVRPQPGGSRPAGRQEPRPYRQYLAAAEAADGGPGSAAGGHAQRRPRPRLARRRRSHGPGGTRHHPWPLGPPDRGPGRPAVPSPAAARRPPRMPIPGRWSMIWPGSWGSRSPSSMARDVKGRAAAASPSATRAWSSSTTSSAASTGMADERPDRLKPASGSTSPAKGSVYRGTPVLLAGSGSSRHVPRSSTKAGQAHSRYPSRLAHRRQEPVRRSMPTLLF